MTQGELEKLGLPVTAFFSELEMRIMEDIVRRIKLNGFSTASADWQITRLQQLGESEEDIKKWIQEALAVSDAEIERIFSDEVYEQYMGHRRGFTLFGMEQIPFEENIELQSLIDAVRKQTAGTFRDITGSLGFVRQSASGHMAAAGLSQFYRETLDAAMYDIHSGIFDYNKVLTRTINDMTRSGLRWIDYESGYHSRVDVAARRAVMTGFRQVQGKINEQVAGRLGTDTYEVTYHAGARPTHQAWQGRVWTMRQLRDICGLGTVTGLNGANCYHDYLPFIPGVSERTYTDEQLEQMMKEENTPKVYNGREYTAYEALQQQRKMETAMRKTRQDIRLMEKGDADSTDIIIKRARYAGQMQTYRDFSETMQLPQQVGRVYQDGLRGRFSPTRTEGKYFKDLQKDAIIIKEIKGIGIKGEINLHPSVPDLNGLLFDDIHINKERAHNVTEDEAKSYISNAVFTTTRWKGKYTDYFSVDGAAYVDNDSNLIRTAFKKGQYDDRIKAAMGVITNARK